MSHANTLVINWVWQINRLNPWNYACKNWKHKCVQDFAFASYSSSHVVLGVDMIQMRSCTLTSKGESLYLRWMMQGVLGSSKVCWNIYNLSGWPTKFCKSHSQKMRCQVWLIFTPWEEEKWGDSGEEQERSRIAMNKLDIHPYFVLWGFRDLKDVCGIQVNAHILSFTVVHCFCYRRFRVCC